MPVTAVRVFHAGRRRKGSAYRFRARVPCSCRLQVLVGTSKHCHGRTSTHAFAWGHPPFHRRPY